MDENVLSWKIIGAAIEVHRTVGPGLLESIYATCLARELALRGIAFEREKRIAIWYKGADVGAGYRLDFLVGDKVVVELKACDQVAPVHRVQVLTYLRVTGCRLGLILNFNEETMHDGVIRVANGL